MQIQIGLLQTEERTRGGDWKRGEEEIRGGGEGRRWEEKA